MHDTSVTDENPKNNDSKVDGTKQQQSSIDGEPKTEQAAEQAPPGSEQPATGQPSQPAATWIDDEAAASRANASSTEEEAVSNNSLPAAANDVAMKTEEDVEEEKAASSESEANTTDADGDVQMQEQTEATDINGASPVAEPDAVPAPVEPVAEPVGTEPVGTEPVGTAPTEAPLAENGDGMSGQPKSSSNSPAADINGVVSTEGTEEKPDVPPSGDSSSNGANPTTAGSAPATSTAAANTTAPDASTASPTPPPAAAVPPPPVMRGTLSYSLADRKHIMRGMWNYEGSTLFPPQRFELLRKIDGPDEELKQLPKDGVFSGSFSLAYVHRTSKGKEKERSKVIPESGVDIKFTREDDTPPGEYIVTGRGTNQFGVFHMNGTAKPSDHEGDPVMHVEFRKRYEPSTAVPAAAATTSGTAARSSAVATTVDAPDTGPLPEPSESYPNSVVCLRGKIVKQHSQDLGMTEVVHRISGWWSSGLNLILDDPTNEKGFLSKFEYEHKSMVASGAFPISGKYSGWFDVMTEHGSRTRINESNVTLKFRMNNAGCHNVEGKGSNVYGKYSITGTLDKENVITIFRHFQPRKIKASKTSVTLAPSPMVGAPPAARRASSAAIIENPQLKLDDVKIPDEGGGKTLPPIMQPANATYSAVSRGVLRINEDGSHSCTGKWAVTREHFTGGQTSAFTVRLDSHYAKGPLATANNPGNGERQFPLDSAMYKGSFQIKKAGGRSQTIVDQQVVMRFRQNTQGSYNVYGQGINAIGIFNLLGTLIMNGKTGGQVELYRIYAATTTQAPAPAKAPAVAPATQAVAAPKPKPALPGMSSIGQQRRESTRNIKLPSRLEDDDPSAQLGRIMDRCAQILRIMREKDVEMGAFFSEPVDPVALGIPTYHQIVKEPMDLRTIHRKVEGNEVAGPDEFARLVRLIFENAMKFNIDPAHSVHQSARLLLIQFNQKFRDVERMVQTFKRAQGDDGRKDSKKRKKQQEERPKTVREIRVEEAQAMTSENAEAMTALMTAASSTAPSVSRAEFSLLLRSIQAMQDQMAKTHTLLAQLSPDEVEVLPTPDAPVLSAAAMAPVAHVPRPAPVPASERKRPAKRKADSMDEAYVLPSESMSLTREEQELLTETINELPSEYLGGVIQIIREAAPVGADEDEIDLDIDQLSPSTQRKLLRHVSKYVKKPKNRAKKAKASAAAEHKSKAAPKKSTPPPAPRPSASAAGKSAGSNLFGLDDSDSDSDDNQPTKPSQSSGGKEFKLGGGLDDLAGDDDDDDDGDEEGEIGFNTNWSLSKPEESATTKSAIGDDAWAAARESAAATKVFEAERKARDDKMKAEAEQARTLTLKAAAARVEEIRAQRQEEEAREMALREQQEKDAEETRKAAREAVKAQVNSVEQTVDLDAQRDIMKQYEQSFLDKDLGSASPSSDFGF